MTGSHHFCVMFMADFLLVIHSEGLPSTQDSRYSHHDRNMGESGQDNCRVGRTEDFG